MAGINATINSYTTDDELTMLTKEDVMKILHLKDSKSFFDLIHTQHLPHIKIGRKYLVPLLEFKKWIKTITYK